MRTGTVSPGVQWPRCEADLSRHPMLRLRMNGGVPPIPLLFLHGILPLAISSTTTFVLSDGSQGITSFEFYTEIICRIWREKSLSARQIWGDFF